MSRGRPLLFSVVAPLSALVALDLSLSVLLYLHIDRRVGLDVPPYDLLFGERPEEAARDDDPYNCFDVDLGWSIRPNGVSEDGLFRANAAGFRAQHEYSLDPPAGITRVAAFGESFVHADKVANEETWAQRLETITEGVEVLNFGVNGYGTDQALLRYRRDGAAYRPAVVLIGFMPENALRNVNVLRQAYRHHSPGLALKPRFRLEENGDLVLVPMAVGSLRELVERAQDRSILPVLLATDFWVQRAPLAYEGSPCFGSSLVRIFYGQYEQAARARGPYYEDTTSEPFRVTFGVLRRFTHEATANGARRAIVVLLPGQDAIETVLRGDAPYWRSLTTALEAGGVEVVDLTPALFAALEQQDPKSLFRDYHYNPRANAVVAAALREALGLAAAHATSRPGPPTERD